MKSGQNFGPYKILYPISQGGMAQVDLVQKGFGQHMTKLLALKRILPQFSENNDFKLLFESEARVLLQFNHPNLTQFYDFGLVDNQLYIAMEFIAGRNLKQLAQELNKKNLQLPIDITLYIGIEIAEGLSYAHNMKNWHGENLNLIHRDVSPQNIMIGFDGLVKLIDFGISKNEFRSDFTETGSIRGKFGYMSPEQLEGEMIGQQSDLYSLGIVLWELMTNKKLFTSENNWTGKVPQWSDIGFDGAPLIEESLRLALHKDPQLRYSNAEQMKNQLQSCLKLINPLMGKSQFYQWIQENLFELEKADRKKQLECIRNIDEQEQCLAIDDQGSQSKVAKSQIPQSQSNPSQNINLDLKNGKTISSPPDKIKWTQKIKIQMRDSKQRSVA